MTGLLAAGAVLAVAIPLLLLYFIARRASNVAKWIFVALTAISLYSLVSGVANPATPKNLLLLVAVLNMALTLYAAWLLFRPDAKAWLASKDSGKAR